MTQPVSSASPPTEPHVIDIEPVVISAVPTTSAPAEPLPIGDIAAECLAKLDGVAIAVLAASANPVLGGLVGLKAGLELGQCARDVKNEAQERADIRHAIDLCVSAGGTPIGVLPGQVTCAIPAEEP
jgi:hypothetical protein